MTISMLPKKQLRSLSLTLVILFFLAGCAGAARRSETVPFITEEEAALPPAPAERERGDCGPPEIRIESPRDGETYRRPVPVEVRFTPSMGSRIDLASVRVELLKLGMKIDLTERAREYIKALGIDMPAAEIPRGTHRVRITVADTNGKSCSEVVEFTVSR